MSSSTSNLDHRAREGGVVPDLGAEHGFSMIELLVAVAVLAMVSGAALSGISALSKMQTTVTNRSSMHSAVRNATELLQQEVGQAGRVTLGPTAVTLTGAVAGAGGATVNVSSAAAMFVGEQVIVDAGTLQETVTLTGVSTTNNQMTATFASAHAAGAPVVVQGGFASGIVPTTTTNGSTASVLKLYGDLNSDGNMEYVEYTCDTVGGNLYRNVMSFSAATKPANAASMVLLTNIQPNPNGTACFTYQQQVVSANTYVVDVAVTLTVQTQKKDPITNAYQTETKALLNVAPRNVFDAWELASAGISSRIQPMPASVVALLP